jgi:ATP-dependent DNA ligase
MEQPSFESFVQRVGVMKPNHAKKDNIKEVMRLDALLEDDTYVLEDKIDGCHYKLFGYRFFSTDNIEKTDNFPHLRDFFKKLAMHNLILDGEIHYPGKTSQYATHVTGTAPMGAAAFQKQSGYIHYTIFDMLRTPKANWIIRNTYAERRKLLKYFYDTFVKGTPLEEFIHLVPMYVSDKRIHLDRLLDDGLEGGVLKKLDSQYYMGKKPMWQWMKVKQEDDADLIITGFESAKIDYTGDNLENWTYWKEIGGVSRPVTKFHYYGWIGSIIMSAYVGNTLRQICTASGMSESIRKDMSENPDQYLNKVARVTFMEKTTEGYPRHPVFKNLHETKQPKECLWEFD